MKAGPIASTVGMVSLVFLVLPLVVVVMMSFSSASSLTFPPPSLSLRWYHSFLHDSRWLEAVATSLLLGLVSSTLSLVLGAAAAYALVRGTFRGRALVEANMMAPLILPAIVLAVALYIFLARFGLLGSALGLVAGHVVVCSPYVVFIMSVGFRAFDVRVEHIAATLGASNWQTLTRVALPNVLPSLGTAWILAFINSFDEVIVTLFVGGTYQTVPKRMFNELVLEVNPIITAIATLMIGLSLASVVLVLLTGGKRYLGGETLR